MIVKPNCFQKVLGYIFLPKEMYKKYKIDGFEYNKIKENSDFLFEINGLINGEFVYFKTDSKKVVKKIIELMDDD